MKNSLKVARQTYSLPILIIKLVFSYISQKGQRATEKNKKKQNAFLPYWMESIFSFYLDPSQLLMTPPGSFAPQSSGDLQVRLMND